MRQYYVFATQAPDFGGSRPTPKYDLALSDFQRTESAGSPPSAGDQVLIVSGKTGVYDRLEPHVYEFAKGKPGRLAMRLARSHIHSLPLEQVRSIIGRSLSDGGNCLNPGEFEALVTALGAHRPSEPELLAHIMNYISARGYYFDDETIYNYHICLKTRPFVILAGLSGTGKSKLSQLYAEAMGHTVQNGRYLRVAVRPSWNDDRFLLGYMNSITGEYVAEPALEFLVRAEENRDNLFFFCLDEMNLAHVEYYFSQFLSALEEERPADRRIHLYGRVTEERLAQQGKDLLFRSVVIVPGNLLFTGTVNVDETTQPLSDKVIDRANTIEFFDVDLDKVPQRKPTPEPIEISSSTWQSYVATEPDAAFRQHIIAIGKILNQAGLGLGYRVLREIELYIANSTGLLAPEVAFDLQVKQRILPRVRGTAAIRPMLTSLGEYMKKNGLSRSRQRLDEMENRLARDGYTSFWR